MSERRAFVYAVCGGAHHIRTLNTSIDHLRSRSAHPIVVVTDSRRNEIPIEHGNIADIETPAHFDDRQASIYLKTSLHRLLPADWEYVYLDADVIAADGGVDTIFDHAYGSVTFARDLTRLENRVGTFSPWAVGCGCRTDDGRACSHLADVLNSKFSVSVPNEWVHWNGGVFLFGREAGSFMSTWHELTMQTLEDPYWITRDQGTLIATVWKLGAQTQACLPPQYNFIIDHNNEDLCFDRDSGYALHESIPGVHPHFLHLYHADLERPDWNLDRYVEELRQKHIRSRDAVRAQSETTSGIRSNLRRRISRIARKLPVPRVRGADSANQGGSPPIDLPERIAVQPLAWNAPLKLACLEADGPTPLPAEVVHIIEALREMDVPIEVMTIAEDAGAKIYERADVFVAPRGAKGNARRIPTCMGRGCVPVIAQNDEAAIDIVKDGENGYVLPPGDIAAFAARLRGLQMNAALLRSLSAAAHRSVRRAANIKGSHPA